VRLLCYDVLHVSCAEKFLLAYPPHTAPDGFFCPACHGPFLPPEVAVSPIADQLRIALDGMKGLQKRLHGLSAAVPEPSKSSPPTDRRPEPEGKEGRADPIIDLPQPAILDRIGQDGIPQEDLPTEYELVAKDPDSDTPSSASDFIATHPGSHARGDESEEVSPIHPRQPPLSIDAPTPPSVDVVSLAPFASEEALSFKLTSSLLGVNQDAQETDESCVEVAREDPAPKYGSSPVQSIVVPIGEPLSASLASQTPSVDTSAPLKGVVGASNSYVSADDGPRETSVDMSWTLAGTTSESITTPTSSVYAATRTKGENGESSTLQRQASFTNSGQGYSEQTQLPFSGKKFDLWDFSRLPQSAVKSLAGKFDSARNSVANARSSSSYVPRVPQSFPTAVPRDDHDDHKYRRKPLMEVVKTWLKIFTPPRGRRSSPSLWRRFVIIILIAVLSLICLALLFHHLGRSGRDDDDPLLDLKANPFVKVDDS